MSVKKLEKLTRENGDYSARKAYLGVFLKAPDNAPDTPNHVGLIYVGTKDETRVLHYVTTNVLVDDVLIKPQASTLKPYLHAPLALDPEDAVGVAGILAVAKTTDWRIRYSMNWLDGVDAFKFVEDEEGQQLTYSFAPDEGGLTCATFLAELLAGLGHRPVDCETWEPNREADVAWRNERLSEYEITNETRITPERIKQMRSEDPFYRLRPEEVAAASVSPPIEAWPLPYEEVKPLAEEVLRRFADGSKVNDQAILAGR